MIVTICYFLKSIKSVLILVQCNTSLSKNYVCNRLNLRKKNRFVCALWLYVHIKSVTEQGFFDEFAFDNEALKTLLNFESVENVQSSNVVKFKFELRHISKRTRTKLCSIEGYIDGMTTRL